MREADVLERFKEQFTKLGFEIEHFGGAEYSICGVPGNLYRLNTRDVLIEMLDELTDGISERATTDVILDKIASMSCKAAVKGSLIIHIIVHMEDQRLLPCQNMKLRKNSSELCRKR